MRIPEQWQVVLQAIQTKFPAAIVAGGCLRDLYHGKPIKDVDIFVPVSSVFESHAFTVNAIPGVGFVSTKVPGSADGSDLRGIAEVLGFEYDGIAFDVIFQTGVVNAMDMVNQFDINICQIGFDGTNWFTSRAFDEGVQSKTLKVMNVNRNDRQEKRMQRMKDKYPEYKVEETTCSTELILMP